MYKSKEIRWFSNQPNNTITQWFSAKGLTIDNTDSRTDFYLPLNKDDISVKLREGNIEIKYRETPPYLGKLSDKVEGVFEMWSKWSFNADKEDKLSQDIISQNTDQWTEVIKTRIGIKLSEDEQGVLHILPIKSFVDIGCQIEYTLLQIHQTNFYTFALEWFGDKEIQLSEEFIHSLLGSTSLGLQDSMGYGEFLKQLKL